MTLTAIETRYAGYRFRSRLEARWAVFFDAIAWPWRYEEEGFDLGQAGRYLPDFRLFDRLYIEVKPNLDAFDDRTDSVVEELSRQSGQQVWVLVGTPGDCVSYVIDGNSPRDNRQYWLTMCQWCHAPALLRSIRFREWVFCCASDCDSHALKEKSEKIRAKIPHTCVRNEIWVAELDELLCRAEAPSKPEESPELHRAIQAARGARFEHGEHGARAFS
jgi:hypothetical protein